ncbi:DUF7373 family lipoprotein [Tsukamurella soli]|uniref:DUF7373 family lipoprotein n=1 Tax=Tsukamurella soli TaxID=644556 RepID=UPI00360E2F78
MAGLSLLLVGGCATTVPGTPAASSSAGPGLELGSYSTSPRTVTTSTDLATVLEGRRMAETVPFLDQIDPAYAYHGHVIVGDLTGTSEGSVENIFGSTIDEVMVGREVGVMAGTNDARPGVVTKGLTQPRGITVGVWRMPSAAAATAAVADPRLFTADRSISGEPPKVRATVPGYPKAAAYKLDWGTGDADIDAFDADGPFVIAVQTDGTGPAPVVKYLGLQIKGLDGFVPTPSASSAACRPTRTVSRR